MAQPGFAKRLENKLAEHFRAIEFLNKYMSLLMVNLKRQKEIHWVSVDQPRLENYFHSTFSPMVLERKIHEGDFSEVVFVHDSELKKALLAMPSRGVSFWVPEMSFFRILKNISENYNVYGQGPLTVRMMFPEGKNEVVLVAENLIRSSLENISSTGLGLTIVRQLVADNFGEQAHVIVSNDGVTYRLTIIFPLIIERESA
jgi:hypothetical protein